MSVGPHVYGDGRIGCWFIENSGFTSKLRDRLPKVAALGVTDAFLPPSAVLSDKALVREAGLFAALYELPPHGRSSAEYAQAVLDDVRRLGMGACELNIEGVADDKLVAFVRDVVARIRKPRPSLRLRINVVPWKGAYLPADLFASDPQLFVIVQAYLGNMDARVAEDEIVRDLVAYGIPQAKVSVMYGAHVSPGGGRPRVPALPSIRFRGSIYSDDLLADAGYIA